MTLETALDQILVLFGLGFLVANLRAGFELVLWLKRRRFTLVSWPAPKPPMYALSLGIGVMLGLLVLLKAYLALAGDPPLSVWFRRFGTDAFGELMMFVYFGYMLPLSTRINRGLYADGIWTDTVFMPYDQVGGVSWRTGEPPALVIISRLKSVARRLSVPTAALAEVRRHLRDKISAHAIEIDAGPGLHLGARDARDSV